MQLNQTEILALLSSAEQTLRDQVLAVAAKEGRYDLLMSINAIARVKRMFDFACEQGLAKDMFDQLLASNKQLKEQVLGTQKSYEDQAVLTTLDNNNDEFLRLYNPKFLKDVIEMDRI